MGVAQQSYRHGRAGTLALACHFVRGGPVSYPTPLQPVALQWETESRAALAAAQGDSTAGDGHQERAESVHREKRGTSHLANMPLPNRPNR